MDDLILIAKFPKSLDVMLDITYKYARKWRYNFNVGKNVALAYSKKNSKLDLAEVAGEIPIANEFIHVGIPITNTGEVSANAIEDRISKARKTFYDMCGPSSNLKMPLISLYVKLYWTICVSSMCYGCEVMSISDKNMELL